MVLRAFGRPLPAMIRPPTTGLRRPLPAMNRPPFLVPMLTLGPAPQAHKASCVSGVVQSRQQRYATQLSFQLHAGGQHFSRRTRRARTGGARRAASGRDQFWPLKPHRLPPPPPDAPTPLAAPFATNAWPPATAWRPRFFSHALRAVWWPPPTFAAVFPRTPLNITHAAPPFLSPGCCG